MTTRKSTRTMHANIKPTPLDKGLVLTIEVKVYDRGLITCDEKPMNRDSNQAQGFAAVSSAIAEKLWILQDATTKRGATP